MNILTYTYKNTCAINTKKIEQTTEHLAPITSGMQTALTTKNFSAYPFMHLPSAKDLQEIHILVAHKKQYAPTMLVVIGIGGSNLGTQAIHEFLHGLYYNQSAEHIKVYFADTVDSDHIWDIILLMQQELEKGNNVILNIISKSGTTVETVANADIFLSVLKQYRSMYAPYVVITTDKHSALWHFAHQEHIDCLEIPNNLGGRFSVFSAVGLFPLALLGIDIAALVAGAQALTEHCLTQKTHHNMAAISAALLSCHYHKGITIHDSFIFSVDARMLGAWYRQLVGESLGKINSDGIAVGITPTVSIGTTDLHSVGQLYLGGPADKFTTFISVKKLMSELYIPALSAHTKQLVKGLEGKTLHHILDATLAGVKKTYEHLGRPFDELILPEKTAFFVGQYMQLKMLEIVYLAHLLQVNPFDQPHVELYKTETRKILNNE